MQRAAVGAGCLLAIAGFWTGTAVAQMDAPLLENAGPDANVARWARGTIAYRVRSTGHVNGHEQWRLDVHTNGTKTVAATVRYSPRPVFRHVIHRVDGVAHALKRVVGVD